MSFNANDHIAAEARLERITPSRNGLVSQLRLDFTVAVNARPGLRPVRLHDISGAVGVTDATGERYLGRLRPLTHGYVLEALHERREHPLNFAIDLTEHQITQLRTLVPPPTGVRVYVDLYATVEYHVIDPRSGQPIHCFLPQSHMRLHCDYTAPGWIALFSGLADPFPPAAGWSPTLAAYYRLAVQTFDGAVPEAAIFFIGAAAEWVIEDAGNGVLSAVVNAKKWGDAQKSKKTEDKVNVIIEAFEASRASKRRPDQADIQWLKAQATLYRLDRNEVGHPQATPPQVPRHTVEARIRDFADYVQRFNAACAATT